MEVARRGARRKGHDSIVIRWQEDEKCRNCKFMDGQKKKADTWFTSRRSTSPTPHPGTQRHRYESTITLVCNDDDRQAGPMRGRTVFQPTTRILTGLRQEQGRQNSFIPKNERVRQRPFDEALRADLEWQSQLWKTFWSRLSSSTPSQKMVATRTPTLSMAPTPRHSMTRSQLVERVMATDSLKATFFTDFAYRH